MASGDWNRELNGLPYWKIMKNIKHFIKKAASILYKGNNKTVSPVAGGYTPYLPETIDLKKFLKQVQVFFRLDQTQTLNLWNDYLQFHHEKNYSSLLGERKTLSMEEAFLMYVMFRQYQPESVIEIGTQYGKSTRRLIDLRKFAGQNAKVVCFDIEDQVKYFDKSEADLVLKDITNSFREDVLEKYAPGLIYLDAHPYHLLKNVIQAVLENGNWLVAVHDCAPGLCNPNMELEKDDLHITSSTGHWERHVLAEIFGVADVLGERLNHLETNRHTEMIFETPHGLAVILPKSISG